jgi:4-oxalocrotonate tautomerase
MPSICFDGPPIDLAKKRALAKEVTAAAVKHYGLPPQAMIIVFNENPPENVAIGGELLCDRPKG